MKCPRCGKPEHPDQCTVPAHPSGYVRPTQMMGGKRARDFVRCDDPACPVNLQWEKWNQYTGQKITPGCLFPHCHPIF